MVAMSQQKPTSESADGHEVAQPPRVQPRSPVLRAIELQQRLGITFNDPQLLARALMIGEGSVQEHLRLAYLGDAALGYLLKDRLLDDADASPSVLTNNYIQQSSNQTLGRVGAELGLAAYPMDGDGRKVEGIESVRHHANLVEALVGAICKDAGIQVVAGFVDRVLRPMIERLAAPPRLSPQKILKQLAVERVGRKPVYRTITHRGSPRVTVRIFLGDRIIGSAISQTGSHNTTAAAMNALKSEFGLTDEQIRQWTSE